MNNVIDLLVQDHRNVEKLFEKLEASKDPKEKREIFLQIYDELEAHANAEEIAVYPRAEKNPETEENALLSYEEHNEIRECFAKVEGLNPGDKAWDEAIWELKETIEHHVQEEEDELFPRMREEFNADQLGRMAMSFETSKEEFRAVS